MTKLEDLTATMTEVYLSMEMRHFERLLQSFPANVQTAVILGVYESLDAEHQVKLLHYTQTLAGSPAL